MRRNRTSRTNPKLYVSIQPKIGLDGDFRHSVVEILNTLLADEAVLTAKTRSAYWHMRDPGFQDLQTLFDRQIIQLNQISDEIAERVQFLGGFAISSYEEFLNYTRLEEQPGEVPNIVSLFADHKASIRYLCEDARTCLEEHEDHGTFTLFERIIRLHEQMAWILRSYIEPEMTPEESQGYRMQQAQRSTQSGCSDAKEDGDDRNIFTGKCQDHHYRTRV